MGGRFDIIHPKMKALFLQRLPHLFGEVGSSEHLNGAGVEILPAAVDVVDEITTAGFEKRPGGVEGPLPIAHGGEAVSAENEVGGFVVRGLILQGFLLESRGI
jgi:hypothetical protein